LNAGNISTSGATLAILACSSTDTLHAANQPAFEFLLDESHLTVGALFGPFGEHFGALGTGKEVNNIYNTVLVDVAGLQDVGGGQVLLLRGAIEMSGRLDSEVTPFVFVEETAENRG
jgi:hypothetical protein